MIDAPQLAVDRMVRVRERSQSRAGLAGLIGLALALETFLLGFIVIYVNFPAGYTVPYGLSLPSIELFRALWPYPKLLFSPITFAAFAAAVLLALWLCYGLALRTIGRLLRAGRPRRVTGLVLGATIVFSLTLVIAMPPVLSSDVYLYTMYGRLTSQYHSNPYLVAGDSIPGDPSVPLTGWSDQTSRYGPVWNLLAAGVTMLAGDSALGMALAFKALAALLNLLNCVLIFLLCGRLGRADPVYPLLLYAWNPLILLEAAGSGHNDVAMMTFALLGLLLLVSGRRAVGAAAIMASVLVKYLSGLLLLLVVVRELAQKRPWRETLRAIVPMVTAMLLVTVLSYACFWPGLSQAGRLAFGWAPSLNSLINPFRLLMQEGAVALLSIFGVQATASMVEPYLARVLPLGFLALLLYGIKAVVAQRDRQEPMLRWWGISTLVYLVLVYAANYPWYLISPLAIAPLLADSKSGRRFFIWCLGLSVVFSLFYVMPIPA